MNVCHARGGRPDGRLLRRAIRYFLHRGYHVHAILPEWAYHGGKQGTRRVENADALREHVEAGTISLTPAFTDDDEFLLAYAHDRPDTHVVSNDHFEDHVRAGRVSHEWRRTHLVKYSWIDGEFIPLL